MKKIYSNPTLEIIQIKNQCQILAGSQVFDPTNPSPDDAGGAAGHEDEFDW